MPFDRLWDELDQAREATPIHDQLWAETYAPDEPRRTRWTLGEVGIALLVVAVLAATVALACLTGGAK